MINRDISWLSFNERVLQEAQDKTVPLIERMRFLGIYSNNLDEFFRVRVATSIRLIKALSGKDEDLVNTTTEVLSEIQHKVLELQSRFYNTYQGIFDELKEHRIFIKNEKDLNVNEQNFVRSFFLREVESFITPIILSNIKKFPYLKDKSVYLYISAKKKNKKKLQALIELPTDYMSRFVVLPSNNGSHDIIYLDDVIRYNMPYILSIFEPQNIESYIIKLTRDAELDLDDDFSESYYERLNKSLTNRKKGKVVRLVYDEQMPQEHLDYILKNIKLSVQNHLIPGGKYHNFRDFMSFPNLGKDDLCYDRLEHVMHRDIQEGKSLLKQVLEEDKLLQFPYHSFDYVINLIREAAIDPKVTAIKISLYRVAPKSKIIKALKNAARNGKQVYVVIELRARFDEEANLEWSKQLQEDNVHIEFGLKGLKVHSKLLLIQRHSKGERKNIAFISTGNFHEKSALLYGDTALLTADSRIADEVDGVFQIFDKPYLPYRFNHLLVAPINLRPSLYALIEEQMVIAQNGGEGLIFLKVNNLVDEKMIVKLQQAASCGVNIRLLVRGVCSLIHTANIDVRSIVGRYLEHSRMFWFGGTEDAKIYLGSADLMTRNLDVRIEALTPLYHNKIKQEAIDYLQLQWSDNQNSRIIDGSLSNKMYTDNGEVCNAQLDLYDQMK
jgi:polyphosphate kinase